MKNVSKKTTKESTCTHHKAVVGSPVSANDAAVASKGDEDDHNDGDADLLLAIAKARANEGSISATAVPAAVADLESAPATTKMCPDGDHGSTTMTLQEGDNTKFHAESKMARGSGSPHKHFTSSAAKNQETDPAINSATEEEFNILDVVRERKHTTDSSSLGIRYQKEMEKQKKNPSEVITSKSPSNINPTINNVVGGTEHLDDRIQMKKTNNYQQNQKVDEEFDIMDAVLKELH